MSTEYLQYSPQNQADKIQEYADTRGIEIIKTYADEGKSGLSIGGRAALERLNSDVEAGVAQFNIILVFDVSRWGRFQDVDESAYYEYICRRPGIQVAYCAEQFENDGSPVFTIVKGVKRAMAVEYSRELFAKVFARVFADRLNERGIATDLERPWTTASFRTVLTNKKCIGNNVFNRRNFKLKRYHVDNPPKMWVRKEGAFEAFVPIEIFMTAQEIITARSVKIADEELLEHLRRLYAEHGQISGVLIDQSDALPSANMYGIRFGSLRRAYALIGYQTNFDHKRAEVNARLRAMYPDIVQDTLTQIEAIGGAVTQVPKAGLSQKYVRYIVFLLGEGEEHLIEAVQHSILPLSAAIQIARAKTDDDDLGDMLEEAYQSGERKTTQLHEAKQLLAKRRD